MLCFRYLDLEIPLLISWELSSFWKNWTFMHKGVRLSVAPQQQREDNQDFFKFCMCPVPWVSCTRKTLVVPSRQGTTAGSECGQKMATSITRTGKSERTRFFQMGWSSIMELDNVKSGGKVFFSCFQKVLWKLNFNNSEITPSFFFSSSTENSKLLYQVPKTWEEWLE